MEKYNFILSFVYYRLFFKYLTAIDLFTVKIFIYTTKEL